MSRVLIHDEAGNLRQPLLDGHERRRDEGNDDSKHVRHLKAWLAARLPCVTWMRRYSSGDLLGDFVAGLTVGLMVVPQSLAYALVAHLPVQYGLYSAFIAIIVYALFGTAKDITLGPTAIMSLLVASATSASVDHISRAIFLCFAVGIVQLIIGLLKLGFVVDFVSEPAISGFVSSAAITIGTVQLKSLLGLSGIRSPFLECIYDVFRKLPETKWPDIVLGIISIILVLLLKRAKETYGRRPGALGRCISLLSTARNAVVIFLTAIIAYIAHVSGKHPFSMIPDVPRGLPSPRVPKITSVYFQDLAANIILVALVGILEIVAIAKAFARNNGYEIDASQEIVALGAANTLSSFFQAYPSTGSFSRGAVNSQSGVRTPAGGLVTALVVIVSLLVLTPGFKYIPQTSLAAIIITAVATMVDYKTMGHLWRSAPLDFVVLAISFFGCLFTSIEYGILIAVGASVAILLYKIARPEVTVMDRASGKLDKGLFEKTRINEIMDNVVCVRLDGMLLFPTANYFKNVCQGIVRSQQEMYHGFEPRLVIVLDMSVVSYIDATGARALQEIVEEWQKKDIRVSLSGTRWRPLQYLRRYGVVGTKSCLSESSLFPSVGEAIESSGRSATSVATADSQVSNFRNRDQKKNTASPTGQK